MCHLLLVLPIAALPLLWLLPAAVSVPMYLAALAIAALAYAMALAAMRAPVATGVEALMHAVGTVRAIGARRATITIGGELWFAVFPPEALVAGDRVQVTGIDGLELRVTKIE